MHFSYSKCKVKKVINKDIMNNINHNNFNGRTIFKYINCNVRMYLIAIEVDY